MADAGEIPLYLDVYRKIIKEVVSGRLGPGSKLPSSRKFAEDLKVSRLTVYNAYRLLEADGIIETRERSGTFVSLNPPLGESLDNFAPRVGHEPEWSIGISAGAGTARGVMLEQALASLSEDDTIPFGWGAGDPALCPADEFRVIINRVLRNHNAAAMGVEHTVGNTSLRLALVRYLQRLGIPTAREDIVVTTGSQQAISLVADVLLGPGDNVVVENPTWPGALEAFQQRGANLLPIPVDRDGMDVDRLEELLVSQAPKLIYAVPTFHNPTGSVMSAERRMKLVNLARRYDVPILEDDALREVRFGMPLPRPLAALDTSGNVVHIGSFTKALLPAARIGYLSGPAPLREAVVERKRWADLFTTPLMQMLVAEYLESGQAVRFWKRSNHIYAQRQIAMINALRRHFPSTAHWRQVGGGPQIWVRAPAGVSIRALFDKAIEAGVSFAPGEAFFATPSDQPYMRLNFAAIDEERIERGIGILGELLRSQLA